MCIRDRLSYEQYLLEVISRECEQRRKSRVQRLLKESALPLEKSLQNFNLKRLPAKAMRQFRTLMEGGFLDRKENVLVFGNPGSGKSHPLHRHCQIKSLANLNGSIDHRTVSSVFNCLSQPREQPHYTLNTPRRF